MFWTGRKDRAGGDEDQRLQCELGNDLNVWHQPSDWAGIALVCSVYILTADCLSSSQDKKTLKKS